LSYREVSVEQVREMLRAWMGGAGHRTVGKLAGVDRKTARRYVEAAEEVGVARDGGVGQLSDEVIGQIVGLVRPVRPEGHGAAWEALVPLRDQIATWVEKDLTIVKINDLLGRQGVVVPYRTLVRFCEQCCGFTGRRPRETVRLVDGDPGAECQLDFGEMGLLLDPATGRRRRTWALLFTAVYSRHMFVWLTHSQTLEAITAGCEAAWEFFGGVFKVLIPDNMKPIVTKADAVNPVLSQGWLDYAQHRGFVTDTTRVRKPTDKARVERPVQFVRNNFWAGESFIDVADAQIRVVRWCSETAGLRVHGTTHERPAEVFAAEEKPMLLAVSEAYDVPVFKTCKVHRDYHIEACKAIYSIPSQYIGQDVDVRADSKLVKVFLRGKLIKVHPRMPAGKPSTDPADLPQEKTAYAMRDVTQLLDRARRHGEQVGHYAERLLDDPLPWTRMRTVYRLLGLASRYGDDATNAACARALELDVVNVTKIQSMLERGTESAPAPPARTVAAGGRFARDPGEYAPGQGRSRGHLRLVHNADAQPALPGLGDETVEGAR
jgi:transposase